MKRTFHSISRVVVAAMLLLPLVHSSKGASPAQPALPLTFSRQAVIPDLLFAFKENLLDRQWHVRILNMAASGLLAAVLGAEGAHLWHANGKLGLIMGLRLAVLPSRREALRYDRSAEPNISIRPLPSWTEDPLGRLSDMYSVWRMTYDAYLPKYTKPRWHKLLIHYPRFDFLRQTTVLCAYVQGERVATISVTPNGRSQTTLETEFGPLLNMLRSPDQNRPPRWDPIADEKMRIKWPENWRQLHGTKMLVGVENFEHLRNEIQDSPGAQFSCIWRYALDARMAERLGLTLRARLALARALTHAAAVEAMNQGSEFAFISVNPTHTDFYEKQFRGKNLAYVNGTKGLDGAEAVLVGGRIAPIGHSRRSMRRILPFPARAPRFERAAA